MVKVVLQAIFTYVMSIFKLLVSVLNELKSIDFNFGGALQTKRGELLGSSRRRCVDHKR